MNRARRLDTLTRILRDRPAATQAELAEALRQAGVRVTQATVSRDLAAIGAVRGPGGYRLDGGRPGAAPGVGGAGERLGAAIRQHVVSIERAASLVVVRTIPGHASVVASALDAAMPAGMVGCVAGDDTVMIAAVSAGAAGGLCRSLTASLEAG